MSSLALFFTYFLFSIRYSLIFYTFRKEFEKVINTSVYEAQATKAKINKLDGNKLKICICAAGKVINSMKRQPMEWRKISANHTYDTKLIAKRYKESNNSILSKKTNNSI